MQKEKQNKYFDYTQSKGYGTTWSWAVPEQTDLYCVLMQES